MIPDASREMENVIVEGLRSFEKPELEALLASILGSCDVVFLSPRVEVPGVSSEVEAALRNLKARARSSHVVPVMTAEQNLISLLIPFVHYFEGWTLKSAELVDVAVTGEDGGRIVVWTPRAAGEPPIGAMWSRSLDPPDGRQLVRMEGWRRSRSRLLHKYGF